MYVEINERKKNERFFADNFSRVIAKRWDVKKNQQASNFWQFSAKFFGGQVLWKVVDYYLKYKFTYLDCSTLITATLYSTILSLKILTISKSYNNQKYLHFFVSFTCSCKNNILLLLIYEKINKRMLFLHEDTWWWIRCFLISNHWN